jgi:ribokinase
MSDIIVMGSINIDIVAFCHLLPKPGETILGNRVEFFPGGKGANQALAAARYYGNCTMIGSIGTDDFGKQMLRHLQNNRVDTKLIEIKEGIATGVAIVAVDAAGENEIIVIPGANNEVNIPINLPNRSSSKSRIAISQFETKSEVIVNLFRKVVAEGGITLLNPSPFRPISEELAKYTSGIIINEHEFNQLIGEDISPEPSSVTSAMQSSNLGFDYCVVTLGSAGCVVAERGRSPLHVTGYFVEVKDTMGAGDCFAGTFAACLAEGLSVQEAAI